MKTKINDNNSKKDNCYIALYNLCLFKRCACRMCHLESVRNIYMPSHVIHKIYTTKNIVNMSLHMPKKILVTQLKQKDYTYIHI